VQLNVTGESVVRKDNKKKPKPTKMDFSHGAVRAMTKTWAKQTVSKTWSKDSKLDISKLLNDRPEG
jgi:hypothetical protein